MSDQSKKLSEQELADIRVCQVELYPDIDEDISRRRAIRDVGKLLAHIDAMEVEYQELVTASDNLIDEMETEKSALMTRAMKDADRVGNAYIEFTNQQTARIEALRKALQMIADGEFFEEENALVACQALSVDDKANEREG